MLYRLKNESYIKETQSDVFIGNSELQSEQKLNESGSIFIKTLTHVPQSVENLAEKIIAHFVEVDIETVKNDAVVLFDSLVENGFLVKGETRLECNKLEYGWGYDFAESENYSKKETFEQKAYFHLPGLFSHYNFYKKFLPIFFNYKEFFYPFVEIGSIYGAPSFAIWNSGRTRSRAGKISADLDDVKRMLEEYGVSGRFTFSNSLLKDEHLNDTYCNFLCKKFQNKKNGIIIASPLLKDYISKYYPDFYLVSSITKCLNSSEKLLAELSDESYRYVVPDYNFNNNFEIINTIPESKREKIEFLCDESCMPNCPVRKESYARISRSSLFMDNANDDCFFCPDKRTHKKYFSRIKKNRTFISLDAIKNNYLPRKFSNFKLEGREYGESRLLEEILFFLAKPEHHLEIREMLYLNPYVDFPVGMRP